jgi:hypothetical protein
MRALLLTVPSWAAWFTLKASQPSLCFTTVDFQMNEIFRVAMRMKYAVETKKALPTCTLAVGKLENDEMGTAQTSAVLKEGKITTVVYTDTQDKADPVPSTPSSSKVAPGICVTCKGEEATDEVMDHLRFSFEAMDDLNELPSDAWNHLYGPGKGFDFHQSLDIVQTPETSRSKIEESWKQSAEVTMRKLLHLKAHSQTEENVRAESTKYGTSTLTRIWALTLLQVVLMAAATLYQASAVGQYLKRVRLLG